MQFSQWKNYFDQNRDHFTDINFDEPDTLRPEEKKLIFSSLQQFQSGEHSEGRHLFAFAKKFPDKEYLECIKLFIPEEQAHARVLGLFMKKHDIPRIKKHWVDGVFRRLRKLAGIENSVRVLLIAEIIAKVYYRGLQNATGSILLQKICAQILRDEDQHIDFQCDVLKIFYARKSFFHRLFIRGWQWMLMLGTIGVVWFYHRKVLVKGGYYFGKFLLQTMLVFSEAEHQIMDKNAVLLNKKIITA
jgi:hypothetical protein